MTVVDKEIRLFQSPSPNLVPEKGFESVEGWHVMLNISNNFLIIFHFYCFNIFMIILYNLVLKLLKYVKIRVRKVAKQKVCSKEG